MAIERVREYFKKYSMDEQILEFETSSATVELAAQTIGCIPARIAKTLSFENEEGCILIVTAGDAKIDNVKFKNKFNMKAKMLKPERVIELVGHEVGGVCPFAIPTDINVYLDISMKRFETVFPACGSSNSAIELNMVQLYQYANAKEWIDACKGWDE